MRHHILLLGLLAGALLAGSLLAGQAGSDKDTPKPGGSYLGKIMEIDVTKRTLILQNAKAVTRATPGVERVVLVRFAGGDDPPAEKAQEKATSGVYTFVAAPLAVITLDGKSAVLKNLKVGQFARVHVAKSSEPTKTDTDKDKATKKDRWEVDRIDAFSKEPAGAARGKG
jgi:hypothetical protein